MWKEPGTDTTTSAKFWRIAVEKCRLCHKHVAVHKLEEDVNSCSGASSTVVDLTEDKDKDSSASLSETEEHDLETIAEDCDTCPQATSPQAAQMLKAGPSTGCLYTPLSDILLDSYSEEDLEMLSSPVRPYSPAHDEDDVAEVLSNFRSENSTQESTTTVVVRRKRVLQSAITALGKTYFAWHNRPQVEFVGELAEDHGGPTREFFRLLMKEVQSSLGVFEGQEGNLYFTYDQSALEQGRYYTAGKLTAWSLLHGGPGLKALDPALFLLMCGQDTDLEHFRCELLPDREVQKNVLK
ncbi:G2/M phase-specific E3 ubiquitin-protein ligase-like [Onychostoma macrolepis]|uniref:G2/M phase-specific E3 ubiquitin-protein ligase-like n=1 Tax=Onychostoma macrolepis TaxID=369639 RepID=UPI00272B6EB1|nr:G2/M phase-specific E3 ubiquitin-protein ligase-like [Onychostoma macrolepis]